MPISTARLYTLSDAAKAIGTHRPRVRQLLELAGVEPVPLGGSLVVTASQLAAMKAAHKRYPLARPGRPKKPRPSEN